MKILLINSIFDYVAKFILQLDVRVIWNSTISKIVLNKAYYYKIINNNTYKNLIPCVIWYSYAITVLKVFYNKMATVYSISEFKQLQKILTLCSKYLNSMIQNIFKQSLLLQNC